MSARKQKLLNEYVSGAQKLRADDAFCADMLEQIEQHRSNTVSGMERISHRRSRLPQRIAAIAAAICCIVGLGGYMAYRQKTPLDPKLPVDDLSSASPSESLTDSVPDDSSDVFYAKDAVLAQLAMVEEKIAELAQKMAEDALSAEETQNKLELESLKAALLTELCRSGELVIAHARYEESSNRITMYVVNGTDRTITLPPYYVCQSADGVGSIVGGHLCYENRWNLRELSAHSYTTVYCELGTASVYDDNIAGDNGEKWMTGVTWGMMDGAYQVSFVETLAPDAPSVLTGRFTVEKAVSVTPIDPRQIDGIDMIVIAAPDDNINHITMEEAAKKAAFYRGSGYDSAVACSEILQYICNTNGRADWEASGIDHSIYYIGDEGNAYVISRWERVCYVYTDPETGESHMGSLLDMGTFGETEEN